VFTEILQPRFVGTVGQEYIWRSNEAAGCLLAGTLLGSSVIRVRLLRGTQLAAVSYPLADGGVGTLPYHSWIVARGDEEWTGGQLDEAAVRAILEPYLHRWFISSQALRLTRPLTGEEQIFGLGERTGPMNKRGQAFPIWNHDPPKTHGPQTVTMYTSIPFYLGLTPNDGRAYGVLVDHTGRVQADMGHSDPAAASMTVEGDSLVAYFFTGPRPAHVLKQYTELSGRMPLPPRWSIGYHQSRWGYLSAEQVEGVAALFRERHHPCDAIWLDIDYMDRYRNFTWDASRFPDPPRMLSQLHAQNMRLVTIIDPGTKIDENNAVYREGIEHDYFCRYENGKIFTGNVWPGPCVFPDYSQNRVRNWWGNLYHYLLDGGVDGIWNDMNEPALTDMMVKGAQITEAKLNTMPDDVLHKTGGGQPGGIDGPPTLHKFFHNAYGMEMARSTHEGLLRLRTEARPFVLTRSGTAGVQRYAAKWTGDNTSRWADILMAMPMCLNLGMSGVPFVGVDIGGFWGDSNGELLVRFAQLGALMPFCRNHSAINTHDQEPWAFGEPFESAFRQAIETRYRLLPYLYKLFHEAAQSGTPIMRPLYFHYPEDEQAIEIHDAFLVGENMLSAPIYSEGANSRAVYLPAGTWFEYWTGDEYPGGGWSEIAAPLESWPLLIRGNSIIPSGPLMQFVDQFPVDPLTLTCYMATDGLATYTHYEDDGSSLAYRRGSFARIDVSCRVLEDFITVEIEEHFSDFRPQRKEYQIVAHVGGRRLTRKVPAGQGKAVIHL
jgi:alpha-glucosidase